MDKTCTKCGETKPIAQFANKGWPCRRCKSLDTIRRHRERYHSDPDYRARYKAAEKQRRAKRRREDPEWRKREARRKSLSRQRRMKADPDCAMAKRERVRKALRNAVASGRILKPERCSGCGLKAGGSDLHGHHPDYAQPLAVTWLCRVCHLREHEQLAGTPTIQAK